MLWSVSYTCKFPSLGRKKKGRKSRIRRRRIWSGTPCGKGGGSSAPRSAWRAALERLAAFEDLACGLEEEQQSISQRLEELRGQRKEKTVQFRELLAQKLVNSSLIQLLERKGLK